MNAFPAAAANFPRNYVTNAGPENYVPEVHLRVRGSVAR